MLQTSWDRRSKQQQEQNSPNMGTALQRFPVEDTMNIEVPNDQQPENRFQTWYLKNMLFWLCALIHFASRCGRVREWNLTVHFRGWVGSGRAYRFFFALRGILFWEFMTLIFGERWSSTLPLPLLQNKDDSYAAAGRRGGVGFCCPSRQERVTENLNLLRLRVKLEQIFTSFYLRNCLRST